LPADAIPPTYADSFHCIGSDCEDTCCQGWTVPIDRATWDKYHSLPPGPLADLIDANTLLNPEAANTPSHGKIRMDSENRCPLLTADRLCGIQAQFGEEYLSHTCATYPRIVHSAGAWQEKALTLSCPEAARLVLLSPRLVTRSDLPQAPAAAPQHEAQQSLPAHFRPIRATVLSLIRNRLYPLWQRLFLLDLLCRRLDAIGRGELERTVPNFLADFASSVATGALRPAMETLPIDRAAQLDVVLRLAGLMLHKSNIRPRFVECIRAFTAGIGNGPGSTLKSLTAHYTFAHDRFYAPFFERHPHIMENFLVNTVLRTQFPFGKEAIRDGTQPNMTKEFAQLAAQFALMRGLLIGVAGHHGAAFSAAHVVHTVQAASKHFEHHPEFLKLAHALLVDSGMDGARGLAILLRNADLKNERLRNEQTQNERFGNEQLRNEEMDRAPGAPRPAVPATPVPEQRGGRLA
jgi:lysine-N-methylase